MKHFSLTIFLLGFSLSINAQKKWNKLIGSDDEPKAQIMLKSQTEEAYFILFFDFLIRENFKIIKHDDNGEII